VKPVFLFRVDSGPKPYYVVMTVQCWDYIGYNSEWMCDHAVGKECFVPDVDLVERQWVLYDEQEALKKVAELYAEQLAEQLK